MDELRKLVFEKINYKNLKMSKSNYALLLEEGAKLGFDEVVVKKLVASNLKNLKKFREITLPLSILEEQNVTFTADELHVPADILKDWCEESETKLKALQVIIAANDPKELSNFIAENPGLEAASQKSLSQFVKVLHKDMERPTQEFIPVQEDQSTFAEASKLSGAPAATPSTKNVTPIYVPPAGSAAATADSKKIGHKPLHIALVIGVITAIAFFAAVLLTSGSLIAPYFNKDVQYGKFTDSRDQQEYRTIQIGDEEWFAQNLNYATSNSVCDTCELYGRLYNYDDAMNACPTGWTIPAFADMSKLFFDIDNGFVAPSKLLSQKLAGSDDFGFSGITSGFYSFKDNVVKRRGEVAGFWLYDETDDLALRTKIDGSKSVIEIDPLSKDYGFSVRCVRQSQTRRSDSEKIFIDKRDSRIYLTTMIGEKRWMASNLKRKVANSFCYDDDEANCDKYGRLYTQEVARTVCPEGWRLPNANDVDEMINFVNFNYPVNTYAGLRDTKSEYALIGQRADFWTSSEKKEGSGIYWYQSAGSTRLNVSYYNKVGALSVRCIEGSVGQLYELGSFTDERDNKVYNTVTINDQTWMADNLNYEKEGAFCYDDDSDNCSSYGRLYEWEDAANVVCPDGWKLPNDKDWQKLKDFVSNNGNGQVASEIKADHLWKKHAGNNLFGFNAVPGGFRNFYQDSYRLLGDKGFYWSATVRADDEVSVWTISDKGESFIKGYEEKIDFRSVRCIKR